MKSALETGGGRLSIGEGGDLRKSVCDAERRYFSFLSAKNEIKFCKKTTTTKTHTTRGNPEPFEEGVQRRKFVFLF
jgi:hypothetical protein